MKTKFFLSIVYLDPGARRPDTAMGYSNKEMDRWLEEHPKIKINHTAQSQDYEQRTPMFNASLRIITTIFYTEV